MVLHWQIRSISFVRTPRLFLSASISNMPLLYMRLSMYISSINCRWPNICHWRCRQPAANLQTDRNNICTFPWIPEIIRYKNPKFYIWSVICVKPSSTPEITLTQPKNGFMDLAEQLKPDFCRCHNSFCVNLHAVCTYSHQGIQLSGGHTVPVSRSYYQSVKDSLAFMKLVHHKEVESWAKLSLIFFWIFLQPFIPILQSFIFPDGSFLWEIKSHCFSCWSFSLYPWACVFWWREAPSAENLRSWLASYPGLCFYWIPCLFSAKAGCLFYFRTIRNLCRDRCFQRFSADP